MMKKLFHNRIALIFCVLSMFSCTRFEDPAAIFEDDKELVSNEDRRFLYINIDGAVGDIVQQVAPATIMSILPQSKYTFQGMSEEISNDGTTWTTTMLGINESRHHIVNEDFTEDQEDDHDHSANVSYPSIFYRIMTTKPHYRTFAFVSNPLLLQHVMREAIDKKAFDTDEEVKNHAVAYLNDTKSKFGVINFTSVKQAGLAYGFSADAPEYVAAINKVDGYIGEILQAIKSRPDYSKEQWMIVIQSNNGGKDQVQGGDSYEERNIFSVYYYPTFKSFAFQPDTTTAARIYTLKPTPTSTNADLIRNAVIAPNTSYLNMDTDEMTVEFSVIFNRRTNWTTQNFILGKSTLANQTGNANNGWAFVQRDNAIGFFYHAGGQSIYMTGGGAIPGSVTSWIHCAAVIKKTGTTLNVTTYQNGSLVLSRETQVGANDRITASGQAFEICGRNGHNANSPQEIDMSFRNLRIWNKALSQAEVRIHACMDDVDQNMSYLDKLEGNFPLIKDFANTVSGKPNLAANPAYTNDFPFPFYTWNTICSDAVSNIIVKNADLAPNVYYWLRMRNTSWTLDGKLILEYFDQEFYNQ